MTEPLLTAVPPEVDRPVIDGSPERDTSAGPGQTVPGQAVPGQTVPGQAVGETAPTGAGSPVQGMIPGRSRRRTKLERASMRILATGGIIGIATALGAVLVGNDVAGWVVGLAVGLTSVILAAVLWSSRQL